LVPLYRAGDVMLVTPFRDGMNLVAKEYVATRLDDDGVLVLSEFTGAADEMTEAVLVNPHDEEALKSAILTAVEMNRHERRNRMRSLRAKITSHDVAEWARRFLNILEQPETPEISGTGLTP
jgi:trehalose 6-phosphate synthase